MRQAVMTAPGEIEFRVVDEPQPGPGEVLLRIQRIGVCGSDVHVNHGKHPFTGYPVIQGHEYSATVEAVGPDVSSVQLGSKVTAMPQIVCGNCPPCRRGDYHICDLLRVEGFQAPGCAQDLFVTSADKLIALPDNFTFEQGAFVEPVAVAVHAVTRVPTVNGKNVAVLGAGPIGNLVAQVAHANGANVLITDVSDFRLSVAQECDIPNTSNSRAETLTEASARAFGSERFSIALECAGVEATISAAVENITKGGTIVIVAVFGERPPVNLGLIQDRELTLTGTLMYRREDYEGAVRLMASGNVQTAPLETIHFPFELYREAYRFIDENRDRAMKVFIDLT